MGVCGGGVVTDGGWRRGGATGQFRRAIAGELAHEGGQRWPALLPHLEAEWPV